MSKKSVRRMSLEQFYSQYMSLAQGVSPETVMVVEMLVRNMQKRIFQMLWDQIVNDTSRTYQTVGQLTQKLLGNHPVPSVILKKRLKDCPVRGFIRSRSDLHDDVPFIVLLVRDQIYLILDNNARDNGMDQVQKYDKQAESFLGQGMKLMDFFMINDIPLTEEKPAEEAAEAS